MVRQITAKDLPRRIARKKSRDVENEEALVRMPARTRWSYLTLKVSGDVCDAFLKWFATTCIYVLSSESRQLAARAT